jgi:hypothetical protein
MSGSHPQMIHMTIPAGMAKKIRICPENSSKCQIDRLAFGSKS